MNLPLKQGILEQLVFNVHVIFEIETWASI